MHRHQALHSFLSFTYTPTVIPKQPKATFVSFNEISVAPDFDVAPDFYVAPDSVAPDLAPDFHLRQPSAPPSNHAPLTTKPLSTTHPNSPCVRHQHHLAMGRLTILSTCPNHLNTLGSTLLASPLPIRALSLHSALYPFMPLLKNFSDISSLELSLFFSQHFLYPMPLPHTA